MALLLSVVMMSVMRVAIILLALWHLRHLVVLNIAMTWLILQ